MYAKENARLLAKRSQVKLDADDLVGAAADADTAVKGGAGSEALIVLGRVNERQGKWNEAEQSYRAVLRNEAKGSPLANQAQLGLARLLLRKTERPINAEAPPLSRRAIKPEDLLMLLVLMAAPEGPDDDILKAIELADQLIAAKEYLGHIIKADALAKLGRYNAALQEYALGIKMLKAVPKEYESVLNRILEKHPSLQRPDGFLNVDSSSAIKHYGTGLEFYRDCQYEKAEREFVEAARKDNRDARYMYYLGLARWMQGKAEPAIDVFKAGALLEIQGKPTARTVNSSLERVQGDLRTVIEKYRP